jgi:hydrogenase maturation factor HypF (carbamoyltransferase family)
MTLICNKCKKEYDDREQEVYYIDIGDTCPECMDGEVLAKEDSTEEIEIFDGEFVDDIQ